MIPLLPLELLTGVAGGSVVAGGWLLDEGLQPVQASCQGVHLVWK